MSRPRIVSRKEWLLARLELLEKEKAFDRSRDALSRERRELPWVAVEKNYVFRGPRGEESMKELFDGKKQLVVYHFMLGPDWKEGCKACSHVADNFANAVIHLAHRDVTMLAISRASVETIETFKKRMGWDFKWLSSFDTDFNYDFHVSARPTEVEQGEFPYNFNRSHPGSEAPGISVFYRGDDGQIFHTYSTYGRGLDILIGTYNYLDLVPMGRNEEGLNPPMSWIRHRDKYETA